MSANPYVPALVIPLLFIFCGAFAKKLVRGSAWQQSDFFLGVELCLAAVASGLIYGFGLAKLPVDQSGMVASLSGKITAIAIFLAICFFILLLVLAIHQDWLKKPQNPRGQFVWLAIVGNLIGAGLLAAFVIFVTGV